MKCFTGDVVLFHVPSNLSARQVVVLKGWDKHVGISFQNSTDVSCRSPEESKVEREGGRECFPSTVNASNNKFKGSLPLCFISWYLK